ncbi:MAG: sigma-70 family RNA polymerase sigma factor [Chthoniobacterales bacterium]
MVSTATLPLAGYQRQPLCGLETTMAQVQEFETLVRNYQNMVFSVAARIVGSVADAEDITQEVFIKAYDRFADLQQSQSIGGWLKTVATNLSINHLNRYRARWRFFSEQENEPELAAPVEKTDDRRELLELAIHKLPDAQRVPLVLFHFQDLSYDEIAAKLGISLAKVKTDIHRGRETLRKLIGNRHE